MNLQNILSKQMFTFVAPLLALFQTSSEYCIQKKHLEFRNYLTRATYVAEPHPAVLATPLDRKYRTAIREGLAQGVNFAGHYVVVEWGCGTGCSSFVIVDAITGTVYDPPFRWTDFHQPPKDSDVQWWCFPDRVNYRKESRLLVVEGCLAGEQCGRTYFVMKTVLKQVDYDPDRLSDGTVAPQ